MKIYLKIEDGIIADVKFETFGCGSAIASSSMATELIKGKPVSEALTLTNKAVATLFLLGTPEPDWMLQAFLMRTAAGGVLVTKVKERSE